MNPIAAWRAIIATPERAKKLLGLLYALPDATSEINLITYRDGMPAAFLRQRKPGLCPTVALFGERGSAAIYSNPDLRPALDAWDTGEVDKPMVKRICLDILGIEWWNNAKKSPNRR